MDRPRGRHAGKPDTDKDLWFHRTKQKQSYRRTEQTGGCQRGGDWGGEKQGRRLRGRASSAKQSQVWDRAGRQPGSPGPCVLRQATRLPSATILKCTERRTTVLYTRDWHSVCCRSILPEKQTHSQRWIFGNQRQGVGVENWTKTVKKDHLPVIRQMSAKGVMCNTEARWTGWRGTSQRSEGEIRSSLSAKTLLTLLFNFF